MPVKPAAGVTFMVVVPDPPLETVSVAGARAQGERARATAADDGRAGVVIPVSGIVDIRRAVPVTVMVVCAAWPFEVLTTASVPVPTVAPLLLVSVTVPVGSSRPLL